ncbi:hypothetical protein ACHJH3_06160 [Campylobacter sp. MOP7]|uniref:hypothetical protein n=1 Tax=Campylobacter canis TaxID=3378588 RepID=UPI00387E44B2
MIKQMVFCAITALCLYAESNSFARMEEVKYTLKDLEEHKFISLYMKDTGDSQENFVKYKKELISNENYQKYLNKLYREFNVKGSRYTSNWQEALTELKKVVEQTKNPLAAYEGLEIMRLTDPSFNSRYKGDESFVVNFVKAYIPVFSKVLKDKKFCKGFYDSIGYIFYYYPGDERYTALAQNSEALKICEDQFNKKNIDNYRWTEFKELYYKAEYSIGLHNAKR